MTEKAERREDREKGRGRPWRSKVEILHFTRRPRFPTRTPYTVAKRCGRNEPEKGAQGKADAGSGHNSQERPRRARRQKEGEEGGKKRNRKEEGEGK